MKHTGCLRLIASILTAAMILTCAALTGCGKNEEKTVPATPAEAAPATLDQATADETAPTAVAAAAAEETVEETAGEAASAAPEETAAGEIKVPDALQELMDTAGTSAEELSWYGCRQLVTVNSSGSVAQIRFFTFDQNQWTEKKELSTSGYVGHNGVTADMHEGGLATPFGLYSIGDAFYFNSPPETGLSTFQVTENTYWVDDPESAHYNQHMEGTAEKDWSSAEHMIDYPDTYEYGFVIDYNLEAAYNKGSAIFFHIKYEPTYGCVATDRDSVLSYLKALDSSEYPYILIV